MGSLQSDISRLRSRAPCAASRKSNADRTIQLRKHVIQFTGHGNKFLSCFYCCKTAEFTAHACVAIAGKHAGLQWELFQKFFLLQLLSCIFLFILPGSSAKFHGFFLWDIQDQDTLPLTYAECTVPILQRQIRQVFQLVSGQNITGNMKSRKAQTLLLLAVNPEAYLTPPRSTYFFSSAGKVFL